jgi:polyphosphate kinase 2 (PPK2 family)
MSKNIRLDHLPEPAPFADKEAYEHRLKKLQLKMLSIQQTYYHEQRRAIIVFEGWDAAGKGGAIRRLTEKLDPRGFHVWPIGPPIPEEQGRHYLYRFWTKLPAPGQLAIFDRSWYGRVLVERVESLIKKPVWQRAYDEINEFERMLVDDGVRLVKIFLHITPDEQLRRFAERLSNPYKRWKLTEADISSHQHWDDYAEAVEDMFDRTSTKAAPWTAIHGNKKWVARVEALRTITDVLADGVDITPPPIEPKLKKFAMEFLRTELKKAEKKEKRRNEGD